MLTLGTGQAAKRIMVIYGTRPEAVKVAPVIRALRRSPFFHVTTVVTGQHRAMLDQVNEVFGIVPDFDLDIFTPGQGLGEITTRVLSGTQALLREQRPDAVIVQGDTTTVFAAALAAFYERIPVVHLEAGLRTGDISTPFPEEANRQLVGRLAALHLAPTESACANLLAEGVDRDAIVITGNTVIDALLEAVADGRRARRTDPALAALDEHAGPVLLVTAHRRESLGEPMRALGRALGALARSRPELRIVFPMHANPQVRDAINPSIAGLDNVIVCEPAPYASFVALMDRADIILSDSGGVQEEGPSLGKPVLVTRDSTERPEAVAAGTVALVGMDEARIVAEVGRLLDDGDAYADMATAVNPYGDGMAAERCVAALSHFFGRGPRAVEFEPVATAGSMISTVPAI